MTRGVLTQARPSNQLGRVWTPDDFLDLGPRAVLDKAVAERLEVEPTDAGANVALVAPLDAIAYERTSQKREVTVAAISQIAADLLTSPGRGPNEAEALIRWMGEPENAWRV